MVDKTEDLSRAIRQDRLHRHRLAAQVHMRLKVFDTSRLAHQMKVLADECGVRGDVNVRTTPGDAAEQTQSLAVFRLLSLWIKVNRQFDIVRDLLADGVIVD